MIDDGQSQIQAVLAANLRRARIARRLSLSELARVTGMSKATLSGIENGRANPTVETLSAVAAALRLPLVELLEPSMPGEVRIRRAGDAPATARAGRAERELEAIPAGPAVEVGEITLAPGRAHEPPTRPPGSRAHVYVLDGTLIAGPVERISELGPGDYASFPADVPHVYEAVRRQARALLLSELTR
jgi:transcriptional regulator with XRE-family HTH domain